MTKRDEILQAIADFWTENGYGPSVRNLAEMVGLSSTATVQSHIYALQAQGKIAREPGLDRTIRIVE